MPSFEGRLSPPEAAAIIELIKSLGDAGEEMVAAREAGGGPSALPQTAGSDALTGPAGASGNASRPGAPVPGGERAAASLRPGAECSRRCRRRGGQRGAGGRSRGCEDPAAAARRRDRRAAAAVSGGRFVDTAAGSRQDGRAERVSEALIEKPSEEISPPWRGKNYLNHETGVLSWLTTRDHKRIGLMYLVSVIAALALGGTFALLLRLELLTPGETFITAETYDRFFTMHGVIMVWLFMIPSIPATFGNFMLPLMIGAKDVAFPRLNLASLYFYWLGAVLVLWALVDGGADTGWTFYTPYSVQTPSAVTWVAIGVFVLGISTIMTGVNFIVTTTRCAPRGSSGGSCRSSSGRSTDLDHPGAGDAGARHHAGAGGHGPRLPRRRLRPGRGRRPDHLPAHVLVLLAPGGLHHDPAGHGGDGRGGLGDVATRTRSPTAAW